MFGFGSLTPYERGGNRDFLENFLDEPFFGAPFADMLKTDISETDTAYDVKVDIPGASKKDIALDYSRNDVLSVAVNSKEDKKIENNGVIRRERRTGSRRREFYLPNVDSSAIKAKYQDGVLDVLLPKKSGTDKNNHISIE